METKDKKSSKLSKDPIRILNDELRLFSPYDVFYAPWLPRFKEKISIKNFGKLSNNFTFPIIIDRKKFGQNLPWPTVNHYIYASMIPKLCMDGKAREVVKRNRKSKDAINSAKSFEKECLNNSVKKAVDEANDAKFSQNPELFKGLLSTNGYHLVYESANQDLGFNKETNSGENYMGKSLEKIRDTYLRNVDLQEINKKEKELQDKIYNIYLSIQILRNELDKKYSKKDKKDDILSLIDFSYLDIIDADKVRAQNKIKKDFDERKEDIKKLGIDAKQKERMIKKIDIEKENRIKNIENPIYHNKSKILDDYRVKILPENRIIDFELKFPGSLINLVRMDYLPKIKEKILETKKFIILNEFFKGILKSQYPNLSDKDIEEASRKKMVGLNKDLEKNRQEKIAEKKEKAAIKFQKKIKGEDKDEDEDEDEEEEYIPKNKEEMQDDLYDRYIKGDLSLSQDILNKIEEKFNSIQSPSDKDIEETKENLLKIQKDLEPNEISMYMIPKPIDFSKGYLYFSNQGKNSYLSPLFISFFKIDNFDYPSVSYYIFATLLNLTQSIKEDPASSKDIHDYLMLNPQGNQTIIDNYKTIPKIEIDYKSLYGQLKYEIIVNAMYKAMNEKFEDAKLQNLLLSTDNLNILYTDYSNNFESNILGYNPKTKTGQNLVGKYLMKLRAKFREEKRQEKISEDEVIFSTQLLGKNKDLENWIKAKINDVLIVIIIINNYMKSNISELPDFVINILYEPCLYLTDISREEFREISVEPSEISKNFRDYIIEYFNEKKYGKYYSDNILPQIWNYISLLSYWLLKNIAKNENNVEKTLEEIKNFNLDETCYFILYGKPLTLSHDNINKCNSSAVINISQKLLNYNNSKKN